jgi:hypothetical protein
MIKEEITELVKNKKYSGLEEYLEKDEKQTLTILYNLTKISTINIKENKTPWVEIIKYYKNKKDEQTIDSICYELSNINKDQSIIDIEDFIKALGFGIGMALFFANPDYGEKVEKLIERQIKKSWIKEYRKILLD